MKKKTEYQLEKDIEKYLVKEVDKIGGKAFKWVSPGNRAVPDRICILPKANIILVECKAPGKKPTPLQYKLHRILQLMGHEVIVIDTKEGVDDFIFVVKEELNEKQEN